MPRRGACRPTIREDKSFCVLLLDVEGDSNEVEGGLSCTMEYGDVICGERCLSCCPVVCCNHIDIGGLKISELSSNALRQFCCCWTVATLVGQESQMESGTRSIKRLTCRKAISGFHSLSTEAGLVPPLR